jgi:hypothetical protein
MIAAKAYQPNSYVAPSILYHLRLVGQATAERLKNLMGGTNKAYIVIVAKQLAGQGLVQITQPHAAVLYSLTERGLAEAKDVQRHKVEVA